MPRFVAPVGVIGAAANGGLTIGTNTTSPSGGLWFGDDTNLYRYSPGVIRTDGALNIGVRVDANLGFRHGLGSPQWTSGAGTPEGVVAAPVGSLYSRIDGGAGTAVYRKEAGAGNTGWAATSGAPVSSVDGRTGTVTLSDLYVDVAGDTMTGDLRVNGLVGINTAPNAAYRTFIRDWPTHTSGGGTNAARIRSDWNITGDATSYITSFYTHCQAKLTTGTLTNGAAEAISAIQAVAALDGDGTYATSTNSVVGQLLKYGTCSANTYRAFLAQSINNQGTGGTITNSIGLDIMSQKVSGLVTNGYGVYQRGANDVNSFAGALKCQNVVEAALSTTAGGFHQGPSGPSWLAGVGSPEGAVMAPVGSIYSRTDGGANTALYRKESGTGITGWVPMDTDAFVGVNAPSGTPYSGDLWWDTDETAGGLVLPLTIASGGTAATTSQAARTNLGTALHGESSSIAGAPTSGSYVRGDRWLDANNVLWLCTVSGTPGTWVSTNRGEELAYAQITANATFTATTAATSTLLIDSGARNYDGTTILIEIYGVFFEAVANQWTILELFDGATDIGQIAQVGGNTARVDAPAYGCRRLTPTPGSHQYKLTGYVTGGTGTLGAGTAPGYPPAFIRVTRV